MNDPPYPQRRHPAHHPPVERFNESVIVQVNICTQDRIPVLAHPAGHRLCREVWRGADFWRVGLYVIMPDHIHMFCAPGRVPIPSLRQWVEYWKSRIASQWPWDADDTDATRTDGTEPVPPCGITHRYGGLTSVSAISVDGTEPVPPGRITPQRKLLQRDFWDTQMRSREHYEEKLAYVRMNPVRKRLCAAPEDWPYQGQVFPVAWM